MGSCRVGESKENAGGQAAEGSACKICSIEEQPEKSWRELLRDEFGKEYYAKILTSLHGASFFPREEAVLKSLAYFAVKDTKVVILGQDPYHGEGQAMGLSFSVPAGKIPPPSLINIKKEIEREMGRPSVCKGGSLVPWAEQGVLLLNATLTVLKGRPRSHAHLGWGTLTDRIISGISEQAEHVVFMLWGRDAQMKKPLIKKEKHLVLTGAHPSPLSVHKGFFGCNHFKLANEYLERHGRGKINW